MKCELCKKNIEETFLKKILGTVVKDEKGKKHYVCSSCQKIVGSKEEMLKKI
jgi:alpha-D-ribose 1-methylphosphonate 5-phosphate C-P lyase|tara:strand:- start:7880 stop:8035 length:156 start_codon:yes stop_codon:yes gene_type:complete